MDICLGAWVVINSHLEDNRVGRPLDRKWVRELNNRLECEVIQRPHNLVITATTQKLSTWRPSHCLQPQRILVR
jgi:hypothetical protein